MNNRLYKVSTKFFNSWSSGRQKRKEKVVKESWAGQEIEIINNPSGETIKDLRRRKFTGLAYYSKGQRPWNVWFLGKITHFEEKKDEAIHILVQLIERRRHY